MTKGFFQKNKKFKGFAFVEVMVSVFLITIGLVTVISLLSVGLKESMDSRNQLIAGLLSQEGIELVRNIRDTNWMNGRDSFVSIGDGASCRIDIDSNSLDCDVNKSKKLKYDDTTSLYNHSSGTDTKFSRKIVTNTSGENKIITSFVVWNRNDFLSESECNIGNKCVYTKITLTRWGE